MNNGNEIKKIAIYTRVSTEDQAKEGFSLEDQLSRLRHHCLGQGWEIQGEYIDDGYSGRNTRRPKYKEMMDKMALWDAIVVYKMDRIHRNSKNFMVMMENLQKNKKDFVSATESLDTSNAMGRFVMDIIQRIAQLESEQIGERTYSGMTRKAIELLNKISDPEFRKNTLGQQTPYGYVRNNGSYKEDPKAIEIIKKVFEEYSMGKTLWEIVKKFNLKYSSVQYWLKNPFYVGYAHYLNLLWRHPFKPAISLDLWNSVQSKRCNSRSCAKNQNPLIFNELVDHRILTEKEMFAYGLNRHKSKHKIIEM